jgi:hypothetical protein
MKKFVLIIFSAFAIILPSVNSSAQVSSQEEVELRQEDPTNPGPRSISQTPSVWIDRNLCQLSVRFENPLSNFTLSVIESNGSIVYQSLLITDGALHYYSIPLINTGIYTVVIRDEDEVYVGEFDYYKINHGNKHF